MCTRILEKVTLKHRWLMSKFCDKEYPYQIKATFTKKVSKEIVNFIFVPGAGTTPITTTGTLYFSEKYMHKTEKEALTFLNSLKFPFCPKCGNVKNCKNLL